MIEFYCIIDCQLIQAKNRNEYIGLVNVKVTETISNNDLDEETNRKSWIKEITWRRLCWTGHLFRLTTETPARQALIDITRP